MSKGGGGGGGGLTDDQKRAQRERWKFDFQQMENRVNFQHDQFWDSVNNAEKIREHKNATATREWVEKEKMRIFDYNNQVAAYNAGAEAYEKQLDYNALAAELATNDNNRKYNEQLQEIGFKNEDRFINLGFNKRDLGHKLKGQKQALAQKAQGALLEGIQKQGQAFATGQTGRSARKNIQAVLAAQGRQQSALTDQLLLEETGYSFALEKMETQAEFQSRQLRESMRSARGQWQADEQQLRLQKLSADMAAEDKLAPEPQEPPQLEPPLDLPRPDITPPPQMITREQWHELRPAEDVGGGGGGGGGFLGALATIAGIGANIAAMGSDDRLKYDITRVGTSEQGIPKYTFRYRADGKHGPKYIGTSAQDLLAMGREDAVVQKEKDGFYYVDYSKLDVDMEVVST